MVSKHHALSMKTSPDTSLIYCIVCSKCEKLYIGLTSNSLRVRFRMHRHASETKRRVPLYRHFARKSHDFFLRDHRIISLEHCEPDALPEREAFWIRTLHTLLPHLPMENLSTPMTNLPFLRVSPLQILPVHIHPSPPQTLTLHHNNACLLSTALLHTAHGLALNVA